MVKSFGEGKESTTDSEEPVFKKPKLPKDKKPDVDELKCKFYFSACFDQYF
jgi:hypothetical protein